MSADSARSIVARGVLLALLVSNAGYFALDPEEPRFYPWLALYTLQFLLMGCLLWLRGLRVGEIIMAGIAARVSLWFTVPVLEADYYRYLWDGHVWAHGINPFLFFPEHPALDAVETGYRFFITHSQFSTIYPPVAQFVFRFAHALAPDSLTGLKAVLTLFDVGTGLVIVRWLSERSRGVEGAILYFLNPLVWKEVANSAHVDSVAVFFVTAAVYLLGGSERRRNALAWACLAAAVAAKLYALALVPLFLRVDRDRWRHLALALVLCGAAYIPFAGAGTKLFAGTSAFGNYWVFNPSLFRVAELSFGFITDDPLAPRVTVGLIFAVVIGVHALRRDPAASVAHASVFVLGALLLLSPVVDAWYVLWILPLAIVARHTPWITFSYWVAFSYAWFESRDIAPYFQAAEYLGLAAGFALLARHYATKVDS